MKNTMAFRPAVSVVPWYSAVSAARKIRQIRHPVVPMRKKVRRPKRSMKNADQVLPMTATKVQHAFRSSGIFPVKPMYL